MEAFNLAKLNAYLKDHIDGFSELIKAEKFPGGQSNPTWLLSAASGRYVLRSKPHNWHFYLAFSYFRMASICQGVYKRGLDGNASSTRALELGRLVEPMAASAVELIT